VYLALPFFLDWRSNPVLDQSIGMVVITVILAVIASILLLYIRSRRIRNK